MLYEVSFRIFDLEFNSGSRDLLAGFRVCLVDLDLSTELVVEDVVEIDLAVFGNIHFKRRKGDIAFHRTLLDDINTVRKIPGNSSAVFIRCQSCDQFIKSGIAKNTPPINKKRLIY